MPVLNLIEMAALLKLDPAGFLDKMIVQGSGSGSEVVDAGAAAAAGALAVVDFTPVRQDTPGVIRTRRQHWGHAFGLRNPVVKSSDV